MFTISHFISINFHCCCIRVEELLSPVFAFECFKDCFAECYSGNRLARTMSSAYCISPGEALCSLRVTQDRAAWLCFSSFLLPPSLPLPSQSPFLLSPSLPSSVPFPTGMENSCYKQSSYCS